MAQSVERPTSAQVMISQFMSSSPTSGSVLTAQSLEPALDSVPPSLSPLGTLEAKIHEDGKRAHEKMLHIIVIRERHIKQQGDTTVQ